MKTIVVSVLDEEATSNELVSPIEFNVVAVVVAVVVVSASALVVGATVNELVKSIQVEDEREDVVGDKDDTEESGSGEVIFIVVEVEAID